MIHPQKGAPRRVQKRQLVTQHQCLGKIPQHLCMKLQFAAIPPTEVTLVPEVQLRRRQIPPEDVAVLRVLLTPQLVPNTSYNLFYDLSLPARGRAKKRNDLSAASCLQRADLKSDRSESFLSSKFDVYESQHAPRGETCYYSLSLHQLKP